MMRPGCFHTATLREAWGNRSWASPQQVWQADGIMWLAELLCLPSPQDSGAKETCQISLDTDGGHFSSRRASLHGNLDWKWELSARLISLSFFFKPSHWRLPLGISVGLNDLLLAGNDAWESVKIILPFGVFRSVRSWKPLEDQKISWLVMKRMISAPPPGWPAVGPCCLGWLDSFCFNACMYLFWTRIRGAARWKSKHYISQYSVCFVIQLSLCIIPPTTLHTVTFIKTPCSISRPHLLLQPGLTAVGKSFLLQ